MKRVLVPVADGFEEIETVTIVDVLRRAGIEVILAGIRSGPLTGSRKVQLIPDAEFGKVCDGEFDALVIPGGQPGVDHLIEDGRVTGLIRKMKDRGKWIGAICAAPLLLREAGLSEGIRLTSHPSIESRLSGSVYDFSRVVCDGKIMTSRGPGTALEFALALVTELAGREKAAEISKAMLAATSS